MTTESKKRPNTRKTALFDSVDAIKQFALWARNEGFTRVSVGDLQLEVAPLATAYALEAKVSDEASRAGAPSPSSEERDTGRTLVDDDEMSDQERKELLEWSVT